MVDKLKIIVAKTYCVLHASLCAKHFKNINLSNCHISPKSWSFYHPYFTAGNIEAQRDEVTCLRQQPPTFLAPGTSFVEDRFSTNWG